MPALGHCMIPIVLRCFSGNAKTGEVHSEQDIRVSDATYLSEYFKVPMFTSPSIWGRHSKMNDAAIDSDMEQVIGGAASSDDTSSDADSCMLGGEGAAKKEKVRKKQKTAAKATIDASCQRAGVLCAPSSFAP